MTETSSMPYFLYRCLDKEGVLLYLGISTDPAKRRASHDSNSWWSHWIEYFVVEEGACAATRVEAEVIEAEAIKIELPIFNRAGAVKDPRSRIVSYLSRRGLDPQEFDRRLPPEVRHKPPKRDHPERPAKPGARVLTRLTDETRAAVLARAKREGITSLSDAIATAVEQWAEGATMTFTASLNLYDGRITIEEAVSDDQATIDALTQPDGCLVNGTEVEGGGWGEEEMGFDRADRALEDIGLRRVSEWTGGSASDWPTAQVVTTW